MEDLSPSVPTFLPTLFGLYLLRLSEACGMAPSQTHFTNGIAEAQRGEVVPLSHTACKQKELGLTVLGASLLGLSASFAEINQVVGRKGKSSPSSLEVSARCLRSDGATAQGILWWP